MIFFPIFLFNSDELYTAKIMQRTANYEKDHNAENDVGNHEGSRL